MKFLPLAFGQHGREGAYIHLGIHFFNVDADRPVC